MRTGLQQSTGLRQELKTNPRLYQAMDLLHMPLLELEQHLKQELLINPFLELIEPEDEFEEAPDADEASEPMDLSEPETAPEAEPEKTGADEVDWEAVLLDGFETGGQREEHEQREWFEPVMVDTASLADHLNNQIALLELSPRQAFLATEFIGNIGDDGYLASSLDAIRDAANDALRAEAESRDLDPDDLPLYTDADMAAMLLIVQELDPPGIGARDLRECLRLQLIAAGAGNSLSFRLVAEAFDELISHRWGEIAKRFGIGAREVQQAADDIAKLDPKPGLRFSAGSDNYIIPDLVVEKVEGEYLIFLNDGNMPRLKLSKTYQDIVRDRKNFDAESKDFISSKLNSANWMIQAIEQRRQTMIKVTHFIMDRQRDFFERGVQGLKPLTLREVAEAVGMHESTVSRVTNEKFVQTPRGVLPLKFFFSSGLSTADGDDVSARGIRDQIEKLVAGEDPRNPLTDQAIVEILSQSGVQIARRTVAKYRDQLGVLTARMRKRI